MQRKVGMKCPITRRVFVSLGFLSTVLRWIRRPWSNWGFELRNTEQTREGHQVPPCSLCKMILMLWADELMVQATTSCGANKQKRGNYRRVLVLGGEQEEKRKNDYQRSLPPHHLTSAFIHLSLKGDRQTLGVFSTFLPKREDQWL